MTPDVAVDLVAEALRVVMLLVLVLVVPGLLMGLVVALVQAARALRARARDRRDMGPPRRSCYAWIRIVCGFAGVYRTGFQYGERPRSG